MKQCRVLFVIFFLFLGKLCVVADVEASSIAKHIAQTDWSCVDFKVIGACHRKTPPYVGVKVRYRQPVLFVETIKNAGDTAIDELKPVLKSVLKKTTKTILKQRTGFYLDSIANGGSCSDTSSVIFNEAHVFSFPLTDVFSTLILAPCEGMLDLTGPFGYISEIDAIEWRSADIEKKLCIQHDLMKSLFKGWVGQWGPLCPRTGWFSGAHPAVASALIAYRAVDVSSIKIQSPHIVLSRILFSPNMEWDRMQMVYPIKKKCIKIGENPQYWQENTGSKDGKYVWIYWRKKECCLF